MLSLTRKRVLVTGGAGFIGSHLVDRIIKDEPATLVVVDNLFLGREANLEQARRRFPALKFYRQDVSHYEAMKRILTEENIEVVFNLAVIPLLTSLERPRWSVDVNLGIATVAAELLREGCYETLIHFSTSEVYGTARYTPMDEGHPLRPHTPYAASKAASDHIILSYRDTFGIDVAIVRPFNNFGPRQNDKLYAAIIPIVIRRVMQGDDVIIFGDGKQTRDFVFVRDVADAAVHVYEEPKTRGKVINLASGQETSMNHLTQVLMDIMETRVPVVHQAPRRGDVRRHCGGIDLARQVIDYQPGVSLEEGLVETVAWYRQQHEPGTRDARGGMHTLRASGNR